MRWSRTALVVGAVVLAGAGCGKPVFEGSSTGTSSSRLPGTPAVGSVTTTLVTGTVVKAVSLPCQAMSRFVQDLFIADKAKDADKDKKAEVLNSLEVHAGELKLNVPALSAGVDVRMVYTRALLAGQATPEQKTADDAQGKVFQDWYKQNACE